MVLLDQLFAGGMWKRVTVIRSRVFVYFKDCKNCVTRTRL